MTVECKWRRADSKPNLAAPAAASDSRLTSAGGSIEWNNPRTFVWTKFADEILETIAEYCHRVNDPDSR